MRTICGLPDCGKPEYAKGWCSLHYNRNRLTGDPGPVGTKPPGYPARKCYIDGCATKARRHGMCEMHYRRYRLYGSTADPRPSRAQRFWRKVDPCRTDGCAIWVGATDSAGYGNFSIDGRRESTVFIKAHHFLDGRPPKGMEWDHLCEVHACVWPAHLELVTAEEHRSRTEYVHDPKSGRIVKGVRIKA